MKLFNRYFFRGGYKNIPNIPGYSDSLFQPGMPEINNMFLQDEDYQELEYPLPGDVPYQQRFGTAINQKHPEDAFQGLNIQNDDEGVDDFFHGFGNDQFFKVKYLVSQKIFQYRNNIGLM